MPHSSPYVEQGRRSRIFAAGLLAGYALLTLTPFGLAVALHPTGGHGFWSEWAKALALIGIAVLALQFVIAARFRWMTRPFGLDIVLRFHRAMAIAAFSLILIHPLLLAISSADLLTQWNQPWPIQLGRLAILALVLLVVVSVFRRAIRLKFEWWRAGHDTLAITVLLLAFVHSAFAGGDFENTALRLVWLAVPLPIMGLFVWHRFLRPRWLRKSAYTVRSVRQEVNGIWTVSLVPPEGRDLPEYQPGQFCFVTFHRGRGLPEEEHHWTLSSSPTEPDALTFTIKESGDFTATIGDTKPGDLATVHGPFGRFSYVFHPPEDDLVFIATGIGITPIRSMVRHLHDRADPREVLLIYGNRDQNNIAFRDELQQLSESEHLKIRMVHVLSQPDDQWEGEQGHIDIETISKHYEGDLSKKSFWLCGPESMRRQLIEDLQERGVPSTHIHAEAFNLVDGRTPRDGRGLRMRRLILFLIVTWLVASTGAAGLRYAQPSGDAHQNEHQHTH